MKLLSSYPLQRQERRNRVSLVDLRVLAVPYHSIRTALLRWLIDGLDQHAASLGIVLAVKKAYTLALKCKRLDVRLELVCSVKVEHAFLAVRFALLQAAVCYDQAGRDAAHQERIYT